MNTRPRLYRMVFVVGCLFGTAMMSGDGQAIADSAHGVLLGGGTSVEGANQAATSPCVAQNQFVPSVPFGIDVRGDQVWLTTVGDNRIWESSVSDLSDQQVCHVAGNGQQGYTGDGGPAVDASFNWPHEVRADEQGNLFIADTRNHVIRRVDAESKIVTTIAGNGKEGFAGDGKTGNAIQFAQPHSIVLDGAGGLLVADTKNHRLRRIDLQTGIVETISGTGQPELPVDGAPAETSSLFGPRSLAVDEHSIWIALREGNSIWRIDRSAGTIHHVAGSGAKGYGGDGGPLLKATFSGPKGIAIDGSGSLAVVDTENHSIRRINLATHSITTVLGGSLSDQTLSMKRPHGIAYAKNTGLLVADSENDRIVFVRE